MSEYVKKTSMGYRAVQAGASDPECTHVILAKEEYDEMFMKLRKAENAAREASLHAEKKVQQEQAVTERRVQEAQREAQLMIDNLNAEIHRLNDEVQYQKGLNSNLLRINKERANVQRNLRPKKAHTGYVVLRSNERTERYKDGKTVNIVTVWETVLQSPYSIDFPENQARKQIFEELLTQEGGWQLGKVGINSRWITNLEEIMRSPDANTKNRAYSVKLNANYKTGYWEYIVRHMLPLGPVPKEMLS